MFAHIYPYDDFGIVTGTAGWTNLPDVGIGRVILKALSTNVGTIFIAGASGTATSMGYPLRANEDSDWLYSDNLNRYWYKAPSGTSDKLAYWLQR